ncbi:hypothetical protein BJ878DRAFT_507131 [Calycina marina]|uniref:t-SNARE coiled-coil homology domain-containing protein n=1 Tax=Calycina marina TaxID=1763456 RepID=A0A9P7Z2B1_9HELO|nr:hypothetical protein BJ878DRAFT_507131 [Calycina marina]
MASRFGPSSLHQRNDPRSALFDGYTGGAPQSGNLSLRPQSGGYGYNSYSPSNGGGSGLQASGYPSTHGGYRPATPNSKGQFSDATLNELESQNDDEVSGILGKVRMLKNMTMAIGDEIRDSSAMAEKMNDSFEGTRLRLQGTMNRMLVMAQKTGVGWKVWLAFFAAVGLLFWWVWLF